MLVLLVQNTGVRIEKQLVCPGWTEFLKYEHFKKQTENWNSKNKNDETSKYFEVLESLKRNDKIDGLKQYVAETVCEKMKNDSTPTVTKLLEILDVKYMKTKYERVSEIADEIYSIKERNETNPEKFLDRIKVLSTKIKDEELDKNINFMLIVMMLQKGSTSGILTEYEQMELKKKIIYEKG